MKKWIESKQTEVFEYLERVIQVEAPDDSLPYGLVLEKPVLNLPIVDICRIHKWVLDHRKDLIVEQDHDHDHLNMINDMGPRIRTCLPGDLSQFQLTLENRYPPILIQRHGGGKNMKTELMDSLVRYDLLPAVFHPSFCSSSPDPSPS